MGVSKSKGSALYNHVQLSQNLSETVRLPKKMEKQLASSIINKYCDFVGRRGCYYFSCFVVYSFVVSCFVCFFNPLSSHLPCYLSFSLVVQNYRGYLHP